MPLDSLMIEQLLLSTYSSILHPSNAFYSGRTRQHDSIMNNCGIYFGSTTHSRKLPSQNTFTYPIYMAYVDLQELCSGQLDDWPFFSSQSPYAITSLLSRDHMIHENPSLDLDSRVRDFVERSSLPNKRPKGRIFLVTNLRILGVEFNPVSFYYIFKHDDNQVVESIVAEVANFPWFEQHSYYTQPLISEAQNDKQLIPYMNVTKQFHVSPFMPVKGLEYAWTFSKPCKHLRVNISLLNKEAGNKPMFYASMNTKKLQWTRWNLLKMQFVYPVHSLMVMVGILYQASRLFKKGITFFPHPTGATSRLSRVVEYIVSSVVSIIVYLKSFRLLKCLAR